MLFNCVMLASHIHEFGQGGIELNVIEKYLMNAIRRHVVICNKGIHLAFETMHKEI